MPYTRSKKHPELFRPGDARVWWAFVPNPAGGPRLRESTKHTDELAAWQWYLDRVRAPADGKKEDIGLNDALKRRAGERARAGRAQATMGFYEDKRKALTKVLGENTPLRALNARVIDAYITKRLGGKDAVKHSTVHKELVVLRGAIKLARRQGFACLPVEEIMPLDFSPKYKPKTRALPEAEIELLLEKLPPKRAAVVAFILATGATYPSEMEKLRRSDVDMKKWMVHIRGTKRETRDRRIPVVPFARKWLQSAMAYYPFEKWNNVRHDLHVACDAIGIERCSPNDLRRSVATLMRARGVEPHLIGKFLGHKDSRMAEKSYAHLGPSELAHLLNERLAENPLQTQRQKSAKTG